MDSRERAALDAYITREPDEPNEYECSNCGSTTPPELIHNRSLTRKSHCQGSGVGDDVYEADCQIADAVDNTGIDGPHGEHEQRTTARPVCGSAKYAAIKQ